MSRTRRRPDPRIEELVTEMLARRAGDIADDPDPDQRALPALPRQPLEPPGRRHRVHDRVGPHWPRQLAIAAVILVVGGGIVAGVDRLLSTDSEPGPAARIEAATGTQQPAEDAATPPDAADGSAGSEDVEVSPGPTLAEAVAALPPGTDPRSGSLLWLGGPPVTDPAAAAAAYLADRLPDLTIDLERADVDDALHLFRWSVAGDAEDLDDVTGWVIVRLDPDRAGVSAAWTEGITWGPIDRANGRLRVSVEETLDGELYADVTDLYGQPVPGAPAPAGQGSPDVRAFGTAGLTDGADRLDVEVAVPPWPVAVRFQHVGGTWLTIAEYTVEPPGFAGSCGSAPPVTIDVGTRLGPLDQGPAGGSSIQPVDGQGVWHHPATDASLQTAIEIRWPPDPVLVGRFPLGSLGPDATAVVAVGPSILSSTAVRRVTDQQHGIVALGPGAGDDPCALVQLSVLGDPPTAEWWATALTGQWSFGLPLSVAGPDLDPRLGPDGQGSTGTTTSEMPDGSGDGDGLVIAVVDADPVDVPRVPATGSCDGLPGDPPRTGAGPDEGFTAPRQALAAFVTTPPTGETIDPPLPTGGYVEYVGAEADGLVQYAIGPDDASIVLVDVELVDGTWRVARWEAAPC